MVRGYEMKSGDWLQMRHDLVLSFDSCTHCGHFQQWAGFYVGTKNNMHAAPYTASWNALCVLEPFFIITSINFILRTAPIALLYDWTIQVSLYSQRASMGLEPLTSWFKLVISLTILVDI